MSNQYGSGLYGQTNAAGQGLSMSPATLRAELVDPMIRALLQGTSAPPDANTTQGLMNWAASQGRSNRAIMPTIPGLQLPAQIRQILQQPSLAQVAQGLNGPAANPTGPSTGQFAQPSGSTAAAPTSAQSAPAAPTGTDFVSQIVAKAVQSVLSEGAGNAGQSSGGGPGPGGDVPGGSSGGGGGVGGNQGPDPSGNAGGGTSSGGASSGSAP